MRLQPGYYEAKKGERFDTTYHLVRVWIEGKKKYVQIDHSTPEELDEDKERWMVQDYVIIQQFDSLNPMVVQAPDVVVSFGVEGGGPHHLKVRNMFQLNRIFELFPRLRKALELK